MVRVVAPSAGVHTVAPKAGTQPVLAALLVLVTAVAMPVGAGFAV
jgi:hypothetical protein